MPFTVPIINLNGSDGRELMTDWLAAHKVARELEEHLAKIAPHGRDFQTAPEGTFEKARAEHDERRRQVRQISAQMMDIVLGIYDQLEEKKVS